MKLYTLSKGNFLTQTAVAVAKLAKVDFQLIVADQKLKESKDFKAKNVTGKFPFLETPEGCINESLAISKHFARLGSNADQLLGKAGVERAQVDQWSHWAFTVVLKDAFVIMQAVFGFGGKASVSTADYNEANKNLKEQVKIVNNQLKGNFIMGDKVTVADIALVVMFMTPFQTVLDAGFRKAMAKAAAWFERVCALPEFVAAFGHIRACAKPLKPVLIPEEKKKPEPKPQAAAKPKEEKKKEEKKDINPLDALPPTKFDLFNFKTYFVNVPDKKGEGIDETLKQVDFDGFAFWFIHYDKYGSEGQVLYKTDNLLNGFMQRIDHFKKHAFARHAVIGEEGNYDIEGVWLFRGTVIPQEMIDHPQFEYYQHRKMDPVNNADDNKLLREFWGGAVGTEANGKKICTLAWHK